MANNRFMYLSCLAPESEGVPDTPPDLYRRVVVSAMRRTYDRPAPVANSLT